MTHTVQARRLYDALAPATSAPAKHAYRVFVDRLWPRGVAKEDFIFDSWYKELAPSPDLRKWFGHRKSRWDTFNKRYREELHQDDQKKRMHSLLKEAGDRPVDLLYGAKDTEHNHAIILADELQNL